MRNVVSVREASIEAVALAVGGDGVGLGSARCDQAIRAIENVFTNVEARLSPAGTIDEAPQFAMCFDHRSRMPEVMKCVGWGLRVITERKERNFQAKRFLSHNTIYSNKSYGLINMIRHWRSPRDLALHGKLNLLSAIHHYDTTGESRRYSPKTFTMPYSKRLRWVTSGRAASRATGHQISYSRT